MVLVDMPDANIFRVQRYVYLVKLHNMESPQHVNSEIDEREPMPCRQSSIHAASPGYPRYVPPGQRNHHHFPYVDSLLEVGNETTAHAVGLIYTQSGMGKERRLEESGGRQR